MHQVGFGQKWEVFSMKEIHLEPPFPCDYIRNDYCKRVITLVIYKALCFDEAQGRMNGAPNETRTHSCRFAHSAC